MSDQQQDYPEPLDLDPSPEPQQPTKQVLIRMSDIAPQDQCTVVKLANSALEEISETTGISETQKYSKIAGLLKKQLDGYFGLGWYVICGKNFGTYVTHERGNFMHFSFEDLHFCCFKAQS